MATLELTITLDNEITLDTEKKTADYVFSQISYNFSLARLDVNMQMYQPAMILADIDVGMTSGSGWTAIKGKDVQTFKDKNVKLTVKNDEENSTTIGDDYYVHQVFPEYHESAMRLKLTICSPDMMLKLKKASRTFVGKRLSQILASELKKYKHPATKASINSSTTHLKVLPYSVEVKTEENTTKEVTYDHMFPFLVQYNESLYDMLARTTNRWGEFMYYRDGELCFGYNDDKKATITKTNYNKITYPSYNTDDTLTESDTVGSYNMEAVYEANFTDPMQKSPHLVRGEFGMFGGLADKFYMNKIASLFANDKDLVTWGMNTLIDDLVSLGANNSFRALLNKKVDDKYFKDKNQSDHPDQYGDKEFTLYDEVKEEKRAHSEFTELKSEFGETKYKGILEAEKLAAQNVVQIDFNTTSPNLKLGDRIKVEDDKTTNIDNKTDNDKYEYIVVGITVKTVTEHKVGDDKPKAEFNFTVTALGRKNNEGLFYPTMLPSGHVRYSGPQKGVIMDEDDPTLKHRVRVLFDWQVTKETKEGKTVWNANTGADYSPWIVFAARGDGNSSTGRHVDQTEVLLGFVGGNIERPYVIGTIQNKVAYDPTVDVDLDTDKGHFLRLTDGSRSGGLSSFLFGALSPAMSTIASFVPDCAFNGGKSDRLEGGFTLGDFFGIYKISGSSDKRNITISSPWGDVKMNAFTGITISAPNGDVKISGKNVTIEAGNNLKLVSGTNAGYKIFRDKKYNKTSFGTMAATAGTAALNSLAKKLKLIDLTFVRSVVEIVMRPVEGALTVKSNRYLKLEAGKNACEYPTSAFNVKKRQEMIDKSTKQLKSKKPLTQGYVELFRSINRIATECLNEFYAQYKNCTDSKQVLEDTIGALKEWSEDTTGKPCNAYDDLKGSLWNDGGSIEEGTLGFNDELVGIKENRQFEKLKIQKPEYAEYGLKVLKDVRAKYRDTVVQAAKTLKEDIEKLKKFTIDENLLNRVIGPIKNQLPKGGEQKLKSALSKDKNTKLMIYNISKDMKNLVEKGNADALFGENATKLYKRAFWLNLLDEYDMINGRTEGDAPLPAKPNVTDATAAAQHEDGNVMNDTYWNNFVESLNSAVLTEKDLVKNLSDGDMFKGGLLDIAGSLIDLPNWRGMIVERAAYGDGKDGCILIGANDQTYELNNAQNPQLQEIKKLTTQFTDDGNNEFFNEIKKVLVDGNRII